MFRPVCVCIAVLMTGVALPAAHAGYCHTPPRGVLEFCDITYEVYMIEENPTVAKYREMDRQAEELANVLTTEAGCDALGAASECRPYVCANYFAKCNSDGTAPLKICRFECFRCLDSCRHERSILPPGMFLTTDELADVGKRTMREDPMKKYEYDKFAPSYKCEADTSLHGPTHEPFLRLPYLYSRGCTSGAGAALQGPRPWELWAAVIGATAAILLSAPLLAYS